MRFALFAPSGKSGKSMNHDICAFCTKWQKYESWDLHFLHQVAIFALFAPSGKSMNHGICTFCTKRQKWQKYESWDFAPSGKRGKSRDLHVLHQVAKEAKV